MGSNIFGYIAVILCVVKFLFCIRANCWVVIFFIYFVRMVIFVLGLIATFYKVFFFNEKLVKELVVGWFGVFIWFEAGLIYYQWLYWLYRFYIWLDVFGLVLVINCFRKMINFLAVLFWCQWKLRQMLNIFLGYFMVVEKFAGQILLWWYLWLYFFLWHFVVILDNFVWQIYFSLFFIILITFYYFSKHKN